MLVEDKKEREKEPGKGKLKDEDEEGRSPSWNRGWREMSKGGSIKVEEERKVRVTLLERTKLRR